MNNFLKQKAENSKISNNGSDRSRTKIYQSNTILSKEASIRLRWMEHFKKYRNARLTCRHFGISPDTFYLWRKRFNPNNPFSMEDDKKNRRPKNLRKTLTKNREDNTL